MKRLIFPKLLNNCKLYITLFIILIVLSCNVKTDNNEILSSNNDSLKKLEVLKYYPNGNIKEVIELKAGNQNGIFKSYYASGNIYEIISISNGEPHGSYYTYYDSNDTFIVDTGKDENLVVSPLIKSYAFFNFNEKIAFELKYNNQGEIINKFGKTIIQYSNHPKLNNVGLADYYFQTPNPPNSIVEFGIFDNFGKRIFNKKLNENEVLVEYRHQFNLKQKIKYEWKAVSTIYDTRRKLLFSDTLIIKDTL